MSSPTKRQVALDLETTGLTEDNRVIEIGCVEIIDRKLTGRELQHYVNPEREIEQGAQEVHGITEERLRGCPKFADIMDEVLEFVKGAEVLIHNAPFDEGFLDRELEHAGRPDKKFRDYCKVTDTLVLAKKRLSVRSSLDQLCDYYDVDRSHRKQHGALVDSRLLAHVYLRLTGGQMGLTWEARKGSNSAKKPITVEIPVLEPTAEEKAQHEEFLDMLEKQCGEDRACVWRSLG